MELEVKFNTWTICWSSENRESAIRLFESFGYSMDFLKNWPTEKEEITLRENEARKFFDQSYTFPIKDLTSCGLMFTCHNNLEPRKEAHYLIRLNGKIDRALEDAKKTSVTQTVNIYSDAGESWLHKVNEVIIEEDLCTDELRKYLDDEFRIIAVCMQKGSRRPDYVLGRIKRDL